MAAPERPEVSIVNRPAVSSNDTSWPIAPMRQWCHSEKGAVCLPQEILPANVAQYL